MTINLLCIIVPTVLILAVLIFFINSRTKVLNDEIRTIKTQLEKADNISAEHTEMKTAENVPVITENEPDEKLEEDDADTEEITEVDASAYNTGKSGKIYTKEELELLIKE